MTVTFAQIEPTTRCNFTCGFCVGRSMVQRDLDWSAFIAFLDAHPALRHVELQGEGEPMLHPRFFDMAEACRARGIRVGLITNGSLLSPDRVERLLRSGIGSVHVSLEAADPATFEAIRGGKFAKVRDGLAQLIRGRAALDLAEPVVGLAVTVLRDTLGGLDAILDLYRALALDGGIVAQMLQPMPGYRRVYAPAMLAQMLPGEAMPSFRAARQALARHAPVPGPRSFFYYALFAGFDPARQGCPWLDRGTYLASDGRETPCCFIKQPGAEHRDGLAAQLAQGEVPGACTGCGTAGTIAARRRSAGGLFEGEPDQRV